MYNCTILGAILVDAVVVYEAEVHEIPVVLVVVERVAHHELVGDLEADVVRHVAVAQRGPLPQQAGHEDALRLVLS